MLLRRPAAVLAARPPSWCRFTQRDLALQPPWLATAHKTFVETHLKTERSAFIPARFVVPKKDPWPSDLAGLPLGKEAARYRGSYLKLELPRMEFNDLESLGFAWCKVEWSYENKVVPALLKYKELHGDMNVKRDFVVPSSDPWPEETWEMSLGITVNLMRSNGTFVRDDEERRQWLLENGFVFDMYEKQWEATKLALSRYQELHGDVNVKRDFVVPSLAPWPEETWEMNLGKMVSRIRSSGYLVSGDPERRQWLESKSFCFERADIERAKDDGKWENVVVPALLKYKELHGDVNVKRDFVVPSSDPWPEEMWEMNLGRTVSGIRSQGYFLGGDPERRQWLLENGFVFDMYEKQWEATKLALSRYQELHGDVNVKRDFVVPSLAPWPEETWEMNLGKMVSRIRSSGTFLGGDPKRRQWLNDTGFIWEVRRSHAEKVRVAAEYYGRVRRGALLM